MKFTRFNKWTVRLVAESTCLLSKSGVSPILGSTPRLSATLQYGRVADYATLIRLLPLWYALVRIQLLQHENIYKQN